MTEPRLILDKFAAYAKMDKDRKTIKLDNIGWCMYEAEKTLTGLLEKQYDRDGYLSCFYAEQKFREALQKTSVNVVDLLEDKVDLSMEKDMYEAFNSVAEIKERYLASVRAVVARLGGNAGGLTAEMLSDKLKFTIENMLRLRCEVFKKGGPCQKVSKICETLNVFENMAECLLAMEKAECGIYLCFIRAGGSADCFFAIFVKDPAGNLYDFHDRVDEAFMGQHGTSRNGRWTEGKVEVFPYDYCFTYEDHDYKGYAATYNFDEKYRQLSNLDIEALLPLVIVMLHVQDCFDGQMIDLPLHYVSSLLRGIAGKTGEGLEKLETKNELMEIGGSVLVAQAAKLDLALSAKDLIGLDKVEEFDPDPKYRHFADDNREFLENNADLLEGLEPEQIFVGSGFLGICEVRDPFHGLKKETAYIPEVVGDEKRLKQEMFYQGRKRLAEKIKNRMNERIEADGGKGKVVMRYVGKMIERKEELKKIAEDFMRDLETFGEKKIWQMPKWEQYRGMFEVTKREERQEEIWGNECLRYVNAKLVERDRWHETYLVCDPETGNKCNTFLKIMATNLKGLAFLCGIKVEDMEDYMRVEEKYRGNSNLDAVDPVAEIRNPINEWGCSRQPYYLVFSYTKRTYKKAVHGDKEDKANGK